MAQMFLAVITSGSQGSVTVLSGGRCDLSRGSVRRCCQSARLALGSIQAGSSNRWENKIASLRGQPARSWGFNKPPKLLGTKGTLSSQLVSQRDSYTLAPHTPRQRRRRCCESESCAASHRALETFQKALPRAAGLSPLECTPGCGQGNCCRLHCPLGKKHSTGERSHVRPFVLRCDTAVFTSL